MITTWSYYKSLFILLPGCFWAGSVLANPPVYWVSFADKNYGNYSVERPGEFLSERALERRQRQSIAITKEDLPVSGYYLTRLREAGFRVWNASKWLNGVMVELSDSADLSRLATLPGIASTPLLLKPDVAEKRSFLPHSKLELCTDNQALNYGASRNQLEMLGVEVMHDSGYRGAGLCIAVLDAGFLLANRTSSLEHLWQNGQVLATRDFVWDGVPLFDSHLHGTAVLSILAGWEQGQLIGSAPAASYLLIRTEDGSSEYLVEEYNWVCGAEYADSMGADIINSSLGYSEFDDPDQNHRYSDLDGNTTIISRAARIAASKGMLTVVSAGNSGDDPWFHITAPADAEGVLAVGATDSDRVVVDYSARGPSADGRVKPDVAAQGFETVAQYPQGSFFACNGTSCSAPLIAGMAACLWQAHPDLSCVELTDNIQRGSSRYATPDYEVGYGIPNTVKSSLVLSPDSALVMAEKFTLRLVPGLVSDELTLHLTGHFPWQYGTVQITLNDATGRTWMLFHSPIYGTVNKIPIRGVSRLPSGRYFLDVLAEGSHLKGSFIKIR